MRAHGLAVAVVGCLVGCVGGEPADAPSLVPVAGVVKYKDKPVGNVGLVFHPEKGPPAVGSTDSEGNFKLTTNGRLGAAVGTYTVTLSNSDPSAPIPAADGSETQLLQQAPRFPKRYLEPGTSNLLATVPAKGDTNMELQLRD